MVYVVSIWLLRLERSYACCVVMSLHDISWKLSLRLYVYRYRRRLSVTVASGILRWRNNISRRGERRRDVGRHHVARRDEPMDRRANSTADVGRRVTHTTERHEWYDDNKNVTVPPTAAVFHLFSRFSDISARVANGVDRVGLIYRGGARMRNIDTLSLCRTNRQITKIQIVQ